MGGWIGSGGCKRGLLRDGGSRELASGKTESPSRTREDSASSDAFSGQRLSVVTAPGCAGLGVKGVSASAQGTVTSLAAGVGMSASSHAIVASLTSPGDGETDCCGPLLKDKVSGLRICLSGVGALWLSLGTTATVELSALLLPLLGTESGAKALLEDT